MLQNLFIPSFQTNTGYVCDLTVTYQLFGPPLGTAPIVLVVHALTGNSTVTGSQGWWNTLVGPNQVIDTNEYTILAIDIPGNGFDGKTENLLLDYKEFHNRDIAIIQLKVIRALKITSLYAAIGSSLGGQILWELAIEAPELITHLIPIATDWKATDWVIAQCAIQEQILCNSTQPIHDARMHAMTFYRTASSFTAKFNRSIHEEKGIYNVESWLLHHGKRLEERFELATYKLMNHLLGSASITKERGGIHHLLKTIKSKVYLIAIDSDGLFYPEPIYNTHQLLKSVGVQSHYHEITSIHGHDAFLIEYDQLNNILTTIFNTKYKDENFKIWRKIAG
ncbi:alpha/beta fold hydrolase [uncultured Dokdonia sp.]|uniref:alpha/beta fold hydrolase n=1 Tax=uncultured Dokdonia sp. TaxID=575653 RepID=UPI00262BE0BE|nr:alpha/beta fold hydrolase [uncultured Dokdonia sp.]